MSGHSHWATIRRKKGAADAKRGQVFTRLAREIVIAAREGGGDPITNMRLAIRRLTAPGRKICPRIISNAPSSVEPAIQRGQRLGRGDYEGYAPHGIALMIACVTDNRNRAVAEIRHILNRSGGSMAEAGSVAWQFKRVSYFAFPAKGQDPDKIFELAVEAGADDVTFEDETVEIIGPVETFKELGDALRNNKINPDEAELRFMPNNDVELQPRRYYPGAKGCGSPGRAG